MKVENMTKARVVPSGGMTGGRVPISPTAVDCCMVPTKQADTHVKTDGVKQRGAGAAERGVTSRGPMA